MKLKFSWIMLLLSILIAGCAAYFSVWGLSQLFAGASLSVIIMASILETGKVITTTALHKYWDYIGKPLKTYLTISVGVLMIITSAGIYGFLSNAYQITSNKLNIHEGQVSILNNKKITFEHKITENQKVIDSKTKRIDQLSNLRTNQETRLDNSTSNRNRNNVRGDINSANGEIQILNKDIETLMSKNSVLSDSVGVYDVKILNLKANSNVAGEVGPLKYISALTGVPMDRVVNYLILLLIFVFDPLAIALVILTNKAFDIEKMLGIQPIMEGKPKPIIEESIFEEPILDKPIIEEPIIEEPIMEKVSNRFIVDLLSDLILKSATKTPIIEKLIVEKPIIEEPIVEEILEPVIEELIVEEPIVEEISEPIIEKPIIEGIWESIIEESIVEEQPLVWESIIEEPILIKEPIIEDLTREESIWELIEQSEWVLIDEPIIEEPIIEELVIEQVIVEEIIIEEPIVEEEIIEEQVIEEPIVEEVIEEPVIEEVIEEPIVEEVIEEPVIEEVIVEEPIVEEVIIEEVIEEPIVEEVIIEEPIIEKQPELIIEEEKIEKIPEPEQLIQEIQPKTKINSEEVKKIIQNRGFSVNIPNSKGSNMINPISSDNNMIDNSDNNKFTYKRTL